MTDDNKPQVISLTTLLENISGQAESESAKSVELAKLLQKHRHSLPFDFDLITVDQDEAFPALHRSASSTSQQVSPRPRLQRNASKTSNATLDKIQLVRASSLSPEEAPSKQSKSKLKKPNAIKLKDLKSNRTLQILGGD